MSDEHKMTKKDKLVLGITLAAIFLGVFGLGFFGLIMQLGPILDWGLNINKKTVEVNTENFETNVSGIFAIGDICSYPGKLKLILSGFLEGALAARGCFKYAKPDEKLRFEFTTTSKAAQERLGIKK